MAETARILQRHEYKESVDESVSHHWLWSWVTDKEFFAETLGENGEKDIETVGENFRKIDLPGKARCLLCQKDISYGGKGVGHLLEHMKSRSHVKRRRALTNSTTIPG